MSKTIQWVNTHIDGEHQNAILSGDTISMFQHKFTLQETDAVRLLMWCEEIIQHAQQRREQRQRMHTGCCDDVRLDKLKAEICDRSRARINSATDPVPNGQDPNKW